MSPDVYPDADGLIQPGGGGLSVTPDDAENIPRSIRRAVTNGRVSYAIYAIRVGQLSDLLRFRPDPANSAEHGYIEPARTMRVDVFEQALIDTADSWKVVEAL